MPVGKGSIVRATNASSNSNLSVVKSIKRTPDIITEIPVHQIQSVPKKWMNGSTQSEPTKEMIKTIQTYGVIEPVILRRIGESQFQLLSGNRRLQAVKDMGIELIASILIEELSDEEAREIYVGLHQNQAKEQVNLHEAKFEAISKISSDMPVFLL